MKKAITLIAFICGAVLMALEISGGRLLANNFGGTYHVWVNIIGVILLGLAIGYYLGEKLADIKLEEKMLYFIIFLASLFILIIPITYLKIFPFFMNLPNIIAPLILMLVLFIVPSVLLGVVSPFSIRLIKKEFKKVRNTTGKIYAISTIGSLFGLYFTYFVLFLFLPIKLIIYSLSGVLLLISFPLNKQKISYLANTILIIFIGFLFIDLTPAVEENINLTFESAYGTVEVKDIPDNRRQLFINGGVMGEINLESRLDNWVYPECMEELSLINSPKTTLILGTGAGMLTRRLNKRNLVIDTVEINPKVVEVLEDYFEVKPSITLKIHTEDARMFLKKSYQNYDVISMDCFKYVNGVYIIPPHLITQEYFTLIKENLNEDGVFVMMAMPTNDLNIYGSLYKTISSVFEYTYSFQCGAEIIIASEKELKISEEFKSKFYEYKYPPNENYKIYTDEFVPIT